MTATSLKIAFHGQNASNFRQGFADLVGSGHHIVDLSDGLALPGEREHYETADVIVGIKLDAAMPQPKAVRLYHAPGAGTDAIDAALLPAQSALCNCFGHEGAIAEYVMTALLMRHVPLQAADADLRQQRWTYWAGRPTALRTELGAQTCGPRPLACACMWPTAAQPARHPGPGRRCKKRWRPPPGSGP